ncbi:unnamed protein product [Citrullus colocynthis]|uniref:Uncharacterized protein n=1 Tax=Citrullus colocynthis TaxID=252529 RepID=A0ABP0Z6V6_9ROSI
MLHLRVGTRGDKLYKSIRSKNSMVTVKRTSFLLVFDVRVREEQELYMQRVEPYSFGVFVPYFSWDAILVSYR